MCCIFDGLLCDNDGVLLFAVCRLTKVIFYSTIIAKDVLLNKRGKQMKKKKNEPLKAPFISSDFDVDDIRAIRKYNSLQHARMTPDEILDETRESTSEIIERLIYNNESENGVRVISSGDIGNNVPRKPANSKGALSAYADLANLPERDGAWEQAAIEKHIAHERAEAVEELLHNLVEDGIISVKEAEKYMKKFSGNAR